MTETHSPDHGAFGAFAACLAYEAAGDDLEAACLWCGWLEADHDAVAEVHHEHHDHLLDRRAS